MDLQDQMDAVKVAHANGNYGVIENLLGENNSEYMYSIFCHAVHKKILPIVLLVLDPPDELKNTVQQATENPPLFVAVKNPGVELVRQLLNDGADVNTKVEGFSIFSHACIGASAEIVRLMMDHGADVNSNDKFGLIPMEHAFRSGDPDKIGVFLERGVHVDDFNRLNLLHHAVKSKILREDTLVKLIEFGADVNLLGDCGKSALTYATRSGNLPIVKLLIDKGANVNRIARDGVSELEFAVTQGRVEVVQLLLERGANVHFGKKYPLIRAVTTEDIAKEEEGKRVKIASLLIDRGADINAKNKRNETAIMIAARREQMEVREYLKGRLVLMKAQNLYVCKENLNELKVL